MNTGLTFISYTFAIMAGLCLASGIVILSSERGC